MFIRILPLCCFILTSTGRAQDLPRMNPAALYLPDSYVLSELPLSALLKVKKSVNNIICSGYFQKDPLDSCAATSQVHSLNTTNSSSAINPPSNDPASSRTLSDIKEFFGGSSSSDEDHPVSGELQDHRKTYYEHGGGGGGGVWKGNEESSGKIQKLFQFSITALAFLAFGGYLLCMIVQAIKSKGTVYYNPYMPSQTAYKKKKPIFSYGRRRRRRRSLHSSPSPSTSSSSSSASDQSDLDMMYNTLISAIGAYAKLYSPV